MQLQLYDSDEDKLVCELGDDAATLASAGAENGWRINVVDRDPTKNKGEFEDLSKVQKYEMSKQDYQKRTGMERERERERERCGGKKEALLISPRLSSGLQEEDETGSVCRAQRRGCRENGGSCEEREGGGRGDNRWLSV